MEPSIWYYKNTTELNSVYILWGAPRHVSHDDIMTWTRFPHYWLFVRGIGGLWVAKFSFFSLVNVDNLFNSLAPRTCGCDPEFVIFKLLSRIDIMSISCEIVVRSMPQDLTDGQSTLGQVMAWCRQATSHYLDQCWPRSVSPHGVTRPQWVKKVSGCWFGGMKTLLTHAPRINVCFISALLHPLNKKGWLFMNHGHMCYQQNKCKGYT